MRFSLSTLVALSLTTLALAAPSPSTDASELAKRQCSCHKVGDEYICGGPKCPRDEMGVMDAVNDLMKRGCSCHKIGDEWICGGTTCP